MGMFIIAWCETWNSNYVNASSAPKEYTDFLKPQFKDKLVLTYPNDDDAVLYQFDLMYVSPTQFTTTGLILPIV
jgi:ABC-type Fe3+ transport system substrate-binding protein